MSEQKDTILGVEKVENLRREVKELEEDTSLLGKVVRTCREVGPQTREVLEKAFRR